MKIENIRPEDIEKRSFEMITEILGDKKVDAKFEHIIKRCIHTSADFEYADSLYFSEDILSILDTAIKNGAVIVTDTNMVKAGINKKALSSFGVEVFCFIADEDVTKEAKSRGITRATVSIEKAMKIGKPVIFAIGNAPTALLEICKLHREGTFTPVAVIGVPVGFVNVIEAKNMLIQSKIPCIVARGRKGGSNIAAAICNAITYKTVV